MSSGCVTLKFVVLDSHQRHGVAKAFQNAGIVRDFKCWAFRHKAAQSSPESVRVEKPGASVPARDPHGIQWNLDDRMSIGTLAT